ncbi:MAG TPA: enoyl-CoA hydratase/isomerase family protein, partial [Schlesneria sp.]
MSSPVLQIDSLDAGTALLTLNRPERRNALTIELMQVVCAAFETLANEPQRRVVLLQGAGVAFCSGLDLKEAADMSVAEESADWVARMFQTVRASPLITIAMAQGAAFAGGAGLLACCDFAIATEDLKIGFPEVRRGLIPALVAVVLADRLHQHDLNELFLIAEPIDAARAQSMGLLHRVVAVDQLLNEARLLASKILS